MKILEKQSNKFKTGFFVLNLNSCVLFLKNQIK